MQLDELKRRMSMLDDELAGTSDNVGIDISASETVKSKILKEYRKAIISGGTVSAVFAILWVASGIGTYLPAYILAYLVIYPLVAAAWYASMYVRLRKINIAELSPSVMLAKTASIRKMTVYGEIYLGLGGVVFVGLFIHYLIGAGKFSFWYIIAIVAIFIWSYRSLPKYITLFRNFGAREDF